MTQREVSLGFLASAPGSGSTALIENLGVHPELLALSELALFAPSVPLLRSRVEGLAAGGHSSHTSEQARSNATVLGKRDLRDRAGLADELRKVFKPTARTVLDKDPALSSQLPLIHQFWPDVKLFFLDRNPFAAAHSIWKKFQTPDSFEMNAKWDPSHRPGTNWGPALREEYQCRPLFERAAMQVTACRAACEATPGVTVISYERWCVEPIREMNKIYEALGLELLAPDTQLPRPPRSDRLDGWKQEMSQRARGAALGIFATSGHARYNAPVELDWTDS